ncbi:MAG: hypothetical protein OEU93_07495 [Rubrivivax sp.]|nr:hypothetical protein [Rubrivivax sp.]MDH5340112.1 hypothetical protein [Rubrivivax sp.]
MRPNPTPRHPSASRRTLLCLGLLGTVLAGCGSPSLAVGRLVDVDIVDRDTGQVLPVYRHQGRQYVAGRPGARYAIRVANRSGGRVLAVTAVDGVNVVSGQTADWGQTGYVFAPWQSYDLTGWRKSDLQVAAFEFADLPDSYAARTGRPLDVGVIGVAVFRERAAPVLKPLPESALQSRADRAGNSAPTAVVESTAEGQEAARDRLGTGHGQREDSRVARTGFDRASMAPDEIVSIQYDRLENLVAAGIVPGRRYGMPRPFPGSQDSAGYVPDPPL